MATPLRPVSWRDVAVEDGFWGLWQAVNRDAAIPHVYKKLAERGSFEALKLQWKPGDAYTPHVFWDSDVAKWLEGACCSLATHPDAKLRRTVDEVVGLLAGAQKPDGYLNSFYSNCAPDERWSNLRDKHELYCAGHLMEAAVAHHAATGERTLLDTMCRYADLIDRTFGRGRGKRRGYPGHEEIELALVKLYRATGERRHLKLSQYFVDQRGRTPHYFDEEARERSEAPGPSHPGKYAYNQSHIPVREQDEAVGHAVRAMYLYSGMADLAVETGDAELLAACQRLWSNVTGSRMYVTGGVGARHGGEAFGMDYELPNDTAYAETCAAIGLIFWAHRMLQVEADGRYADVMERALYNGFLAGVGLDGRSFFYVNPLACDGKHLDDRHTGMRPAWHGCSCCPTNDVRMLASVGEYAYSTGDDALYVHLYMRGRGRAVVGETTVQLDVQTDYPWSGSVRLLVRPERPARFTIKLRVPGWCPSAAATVEGKPVGGRPKSGGYLPISRRWEPGDRIELRLAMPVQLLNAHPRVASCTGRVAIQRGPLIYCLEQADHRSDVRTLSISPETELKPVHRRNLLGGVTVLTGKGRAASRPDRIGLYDQRPPATQDVSITAIPYYAWANRSPGPMAVWVPTI
jgi:hypothetical protein